MNVSELLQRPPAELARWLGLAGLLPFAGTSLGALLLPPPAAHWSLHALITYGAVILSFLGGITWGCCLGGTVLDDAAAREEFAYGVCPSLAGWAALLLPAGAASWWLLAGFAAAWAHDRWRAERLDLPEWFQRLRTQLSAGASVALLLAALYA